MGASITRDGQWLLYGLVLTKDLWSSKYHLMKMDTKTGQATEIGNGANPTWSPDEKQITYLYLDGIYVMNADGTDNRRVLQHNFTEIGNPEQIDPFGPLPRWSPDGKWLVYHRCNKAECLLFDNTIYKLEIATGLETELAPAGLFPDWKR